MGVGLMFSEAFQKSAVALYGAKLDWSSQTIYLIRILGSFALVLGGLAAIGSKDPVKHEAVIWAFVGLFVLRNISRHLYSQELYEGFSVTPVVNDLTTTFFAIQAIALIYLLLLAKRKTNRAETHSTPQ